MYVKYLQIFMYIFGNLTITNRQTMILLTKNRFLIIGTGFAAVEEVYTIGLHKPYW